MASRDRERELARKKLERRMTKRAEEQRKRRRLWASIAVVAALALLIGGTVWVVLSVMDDDSSNKKDDAQSDETACTYTRTETDESLVKDVGLPSAKDVSDTGEATISLETNKGTVVFKADKAKAPCTLNSWSYLAGKKFYDNNVCHRSSDIFMQCGDPIADGKGAKDNPEDTDGRGGPGYQYKDENLPEGRHPAYPKGTLAMANSGPDTVGSQFFLLTKDTELNGPNYTVVGEATEETMNVVDALGAVENDGAFDPQSGIGQPSEPVTITTVSVTE